MAIDDPFIYKKKICMKNGERIKIHERLATLETQVDTIMTNHLPHIQKAVDKLGNKFWAVIILLIANLVGLLISLIINFFK